MSAHEFALVVDDQLLGAIGDTVTVIDRNGVVRATSAEIRLFLGHATDTWVGNNLIDLLHPADMIEAEATLIRLLDDPGYEAGGDIRMRHAHGHWEIIEYEGHNRLDTPLDGIVLTARVVTEQRRRRRQREAETEIIELIGGGASVATIFYAITQMIEAQADGGLAAVLLLDENDVLRAGAAPNIPAELFATVDGLSHDPLGNADELSLAGAVHQQRELNVVDIAAESRLGDLREAFTSSGMRGCWSVPITYAHREHGFGSVVTFYPHNRGPGPYERDAVDSASRLAGIAIERDRLEAHIRHLSEHDLLTGLPNRATITTLLDGLLDRPRLEGRVVATMFLDLDAFNVINDSLGHASGDRLLGLFAERIQKQLPGHATLARFGGDEFVIVVDHRDGATEARRIATDIDRLLSTPFEIERQDVFLTTGVGVATAAVGSGTTADMLLRNADAALFQAKQKGRAGFILFDPDMRTKIVDRLHAESRLRHALDRNEFTLRYQPKIDLATGQIIGAETLLRWNHPDDGLVGPDKVIPWAESTGLIIQLGEWVLETAVRQARAWVDLAGDDDFLLAVNVSGRQIASPGFPQAVLDVLERYEWPPSQLVLELTESVLIADSDKTLRALRQLKDLGVLLALDDFGTGYSSLSYLHRFPIDIVKVDRAFVADLERVDSSPVATAVVAMARAFNLRTAAEGIETESQLAAVRELGCDWGQGFLMSEAVPPAEFTELLRSNPTW